MTRTPTRTEGELRPPRTARRGGGAAPRRGKTPRTARATRNTSSYRALRQFDFKYLQPLLLAVPMKRLPRDDANAEGAAAVGATRETRGRGGGEPADRRAGAPVRGG